MKRLFLLALAAGTMLVVTSCGSDPAPTTPSTTVDRSSAQATAVAFANLFASGDLPAACELANDQGKQQLGSKCQRRQDWSTTVTLTGDCAKAVGPTGARTFFFDAPTGSLNRNSRLEVDVTPGSDNTWSVIGAVTPQEGGGHSPCATTSASASNATGSPSGTAGSGG